MALDVVCLVVPFATGSAALKATVKTANAIDNVLDVTKAVNRADDVVDVIRAGDRIDDAIDAGKAVGKIAGKSDEVIGIATKLDDGYDSFKAFKKAVGSAGDNKQWHHIVEQSQIGKNGITSKMVNSIDNLKAIDTKTHRQISAYYSSLYGDTGMTTRKMLQGKSFEYQYNFGLDILKKFGVL